MAEELVSTVGILATSKASCNVVKADENGVVILSEYPQMTNGTCIGGGGYFEGKGIVIGSGNGLVEGYENTQIIIGNGACVNKCTEGSYGYYNDNNVVIGSNASAMAGDAVVIGKEAYAFQGGVAIGCQSRAEGQLSTALGFYAKASGVNSMALGTGACAGGCYSTALGDHASASGDSSTALGYGADACGIGSLAMGYCAKAAENEIVLKSINAANTACNVLKVSSEGVLTLNGEEVGGLDISQGIVIGEGASAEGNYSNIAIGACAYAFGGSSMALGYTASASGNSSTALGYEACASDEHSTALGSGAHAFGFASTALGASANACGYSSTALGYYACAYGGGALAIGYYAEAAENEIVLRSANAANTACNVLKISSTGVLTLNNTEIKPTCVVTDLQTILASATTVDTTENAFTLKQVADSLNTLITLLKGTATATTE